jgi:hypothetical protein
MWGSFSGRSGATGALVVLDCDGSAVARCGPTPVLPTDAPGAHSRRVLSAGQCRRSRRDRGGRRQGPMHPFLPRLSVQNADCADLLVVPTSRPDRLLSKGSATAKSAQSSTRPIWSQGRHNHEVGTVGVVPTSEQRRFGAPAPARRRGRCPSIYAPADSVTVSRMTIP